LVTLLLDRVTNTVTYPPTHTQTVLEETMKRELVAPCADDMTARAKLVFDLSLGLDRNLAPTSGNPPMNTRFESWTAHCDPARPLRTFWHRPTKTTRPTWAEEPENGEAIQIIAGAIIALIAVCALMWGIGQASASSDRALIAHAQVQP
jgi:hypothetical protein